MLKENLTRLTGDRHRAASYPARSCHWFSSNAYRTFAALLLVALIGSASLIACSAKAQAQAQTKPQPSINIDTLPQTLTGHLHFLDDPEGQLQLTDVLHAWQQGRFQPFPDTLGRGYIDGVSWLGLRLTNPSDAP
jgi:hypothetical protein